MRETGSFASPKDSIESDQYHFVSMCHIRMTWTGWVGGLNKNPPFGVESQRTPPLESLDLDYEYKGLFEDMSDMDDWDCVGIHIFIRFVLQGNNCIINQSLLPT